jgi:hypothetical protein
MEDPEGSRGEFDGSVPVLQGSISLIIFEKPAAAKYSASS